MKILSYNVFCVKKTEPPIPEWEVRQVNLKNTIEDILRDKDIKVICFQEVNSRNIKMLKKVLEDNNFKWLKPYPMKTRGPIQYNIVAILNDKEIEIEEIFCLPHGKDEHYKPLLLQNVDYGMSDYRTTVFVLLTYKNRKYLIGNIHTDYASLEGKIQGPIKSLDYMEKINCDYGVLVGDMNTVSHMVDSYAILQAKSEYMPMVQKNQLILIMLS